MMDDSMWGMILGRSGRVPGEIDPALKEIEALGLDCGIIGRVTEKREKKIYVLK